MHKAVIWIVLLAGLSLAGCAARPAWPEQPAVRMGSDSAPSADMWEPRGPGGGRYLQVYREGVKRALYVDADGSGQYRPLADLDAPDPARVRHVVILLDGVPAELIEELYAQGHFRLFHRPARLISTFPSLTEVSFPAILGVPGTSALEACFYDPHANRLHGGWSVYLKGDNEYWAHGLDYRQPLWVDGLSYLWSVHMTRREWGGMFAKLPKVLQALPPGQTVTVYAISPDAVGHDGDREGARAVLVELDRWIERQLYRSEGHGAVTRLTDHGNNFVPDCRRADLEASLIGAGLVPVHEGGFEKPGEVVLPRYGLISAARAWCQSEADRAGVVEAWAAAPGVEHVIWRQGDVVYVRGQLGQAQIRHAALPRPDGSVEELFSYTPTDGDPLELSAILAGLPGVDPPAEGPDPAGGARFYRAADLLAASAEHRWPDALWRIWHGMDDHMAAVPDVVASLEPGWYYGAPGMDRFTTLHGTHGGLAYGDSVGFFMSTVEQPPPVMRTVDVLDQVNRRYHWNPRQHLPETNPVDAYFLRPGLVGRRNLE